MGKLVIVRRWVEERHIEFTREDLELHDARREQKSQMEICPKPLPYMEAFTRHLEVCPYCGKAPRIHGLWKDKRGFYSIKLTCCMENDLECGDWYKQLSRAGLDWNYRVRHQRGEPLKSVPHFYKNER